MRQVLMSTGLALGAAVAAAFIALAIDGDGGTTVVQEGPAAPEGGERGGCGLGERGWRERGAGRRCGS